MSKTVVNEESLGLEIVIRFNPSTLEFSLTGCDKNPVVALGVLDYALARVRRSLVTSDVQREMQNVPRVSLASRLVE